MLLVGQELERELACCFLRSCPTGLSGRGGETLADRGWEVASDARTEEGIISSRVEQRCLPLSQAYSNGKPLNNHQHNP